MRRRILVLSSSTGSGHDSRARAFAEWVHELYPDQFDLRIEQVIENGSGLGKFGVNLYNWIQQQWPRLHHVYFFIVEALVWMHRGKVAFGGKYYRRLLQEFEPDIIFSVHDSTNRGYFEDAKRLLGPQVRCVTYCGEYSGGYGYSRNWINSHADAFIARTETAAAFAARHGMPQERISVFHKFLPPSAFKPQLDPRERKRLLRALGLSAERLTLFLATGGYGANHHKEFLQALAPLADQIQFIVICGQNKAILEHLRNWLKSQPQIRCHIEGYCRRVPAYLQISDAIVTRGGANTTTEAMHFNCPILFNALGGLMPQETCTTRYLLEHNAAIKIDKPGDLHRTVNRWLEDPEELLQLRAAMAAMDHPEEHPRDLIQRICDGVPATA